MQWIPETWAGVVKASSIAFDLYVAVPASSPIPIWVMSLIMRPILHVSISARMQGLRGLRTNDGLAVLELFRKRLGIDGLAIILRNCLEQAHLDAHHDANILDDLHIVQVSVFGHGLFRLRIYRTWFLIPWRYS